MPSHNLAAKASDSRSLALKLRGLPEVPVLPGLPSEFDRLAVGKERLLSSYEEDCPYFVQRAAQEVTAAVKAAHPKARLVHLKMAQRYEALSREPFGQRNSVDCGPKLAGDQMSASDPLRALRREKVTQD